MDKIITQAQELLQQGESAFVIFTSGHQLEINPDGTALQVTGHRLQVR